jgi:hypothetical protein
MMRAFTAASIAVTLLASAGHAAPGERDRLNACKAMIERSAQARPSGAALDEAELKKCRQIVKEWTLRDSRMSVDENGRPLR